MASSFRKNTNGNIGTIAALLLVPILFSVGAGIDHLRASKAQAQLQQAVDASALGTALAKSRDRRTRLKPTGQSIFYDNVSADERLLVDSVEVKRTGRDRVQVVARARFEPMFIQLMGYPRMEIAAHAEANLQTSRRTEIAIAFDSTRSMNFDTRWYTAMSTMQATVNDMEGLSANDGFHLTLVPFADRVNIGSARSGWVGGPRPTGWEGCVDPREVADGDFQWALDSENPTVAPFTASNPTDAAHWGEYNCPEVEITGPTNQIEQITRAMNRMTPGGTGRLDQGMAWAWRALSPKWRGYWGLADFPATADEDVRKKLIYVSDGNTDAYLDAMDQQSTWGPNLGSETGFEHLVELCRKIKQDGIDIYMINVRGNPHAESYFEQCATSSAHYYLVDDASNITLAVDDIRSELEAELRLVR